LQAEEARFRAQLKELEQQRMSVIEQQWWKRERAREGEAAALKAEYARLEQQTKTLLAAVQVSKCSCWWKETQSVAVVLMCDTATLVAGKERASDNFGQAPCNCKHC
jgi:hypothetical protein